MESNVSFFSLPVVDNGDVDFSKIKCDNEDLHPTLLYVLTQFLSGDEPLEEPDLNGPTTLHCEICRKQFDNAKKYYGHLRVHSKDNLWMCDKCPNEKFSTKQQLMKHSLIHKPLERVWQCPQCDMSFEALWRLQQHLFAKHLDYRPHKCDTCEMSFHKLSDLKKHQDIHNDVKKHECIECKKKFRDISNMKRHMLSHRDERPYPCPGCGNRFKQIASMKRHSQRCAMVKQGTEITDKTIRKNYCRVCGLTFQYKSALLEHCVRQHPNNQTSPAPIKTANVEKSNQLKIDTNPSVIGNSNRPRHIKASQHVKKDKCQPVDAIQPHQNTKQRVKAHNLSNSASIVSSQTLNTISIPIITLNSDNSHISTITTSHAHNKTTSRTVNINTNRQINYETDQTVRTEASTSKNTNRSINIISNCLLNFDTIQPVDTINRNTSHSVNLDTNHIVNRQTSFPVINTSRQVIVDTSHSVSIATSHLLNIGPSHPVNIDNNHPMDKSTTVPANINASYLNLNTSHPVDTDTSQSVNTNISKPLNLTTTQHVVNSNSSLNVNIDATHPSSVDINRQLNIDTNRTVDNIVDDILSAEDDYLNRHPMSNQMLNYNPQEPDNHENLMQIELLKDMNQMHILDDELLYNDLDFDSFQTMCNTNDMDYTDKNELLFDIADGRSIDQDLMNALYQVKGDNLPEELLNEPGILNNNDKVNDFLTNPAVSVNECSTIFESDVDLEASTNLAANLNQLIGENFVQYISTEHDDTFIISLNSEIDAEQLTDMLNIGGGSMDENTKNIVKQTTKENIETTSEPSIVTVANVPENNDHMKSTNQTVTQPILVKVDGVTNKDNKADIPQQKTKAVKTKKRIVYVCRKCNKVFKKKDNYKSHRATHDASLRQHKCNICSERFSYRSTLNKHVKKQHMPLVKAAHECTQCDKSYVAAWMLKRHLTRDHEMILPFLCDEKGCGKKFYIQCDLDIHKRFHADERPYTCDICNRGFHLMSHYKRHVRTVDCTTKIVKKADITQASRNKTIII